MTNPKRIALLAITVSALVTAGGIGFLATARTDLESKLRACWTIVDRRAALEREMLCQSYREWSKRAGQQVEGMEDYCR